MFILSRRSISTEHSTASGPPNAPPPGFKLEDAKKPLPVDATKKTTDSTKSAPVASPQTTVGQEEKAAASTKETTALEVKKEEVKKTLWEKVKHELNHYWDGTKLLGAEIKISTRLALKMAAGYELSRREHRQASASGYWKNFC